MGHLMQKEHLQGALFVVTTFGFELLCRNKISND